MNLKTIDGKPRPKFTATEARKVREVQLLLSMAGQLDEPAELISDALQSFAERIDSDGVLPAAEEPDPRPMPEAVE